MFERIPFSKQIYLENHIDQSHFPISHDVNCDGSNKMIRMRLATNIYIFVQMNAKQSIKLHIVIEIRITLELKINSHMCCINNTYGS